MGAFVDFLVNNYIIFLVIALVLIFALIGYLVENKKRKENGELPPEPKKEKPAQVGSLEELKQGLENKSLNQAVDKMTTEDSAKEATPSIEVKPVVAPEPVKPAESVPTLDTNFSSNNLNTDGLGSIPKAPVATATEFDKPAAVPSLEPQPVAEPKTEESPK